MTEITPVPAAAWAARWDAVAARARAWLAAQGLEARDAVVLLPFAGVLPALRDAWARTGAGRGWQPRIETPRTLAESLAPPPEPAAGAPTGDRTLDALLATALLRQRPGLREGARRSGGERTLAHLAALLVDAAHALRQGAAERPPAERTAWWSEVRRRCPPAAGPGSLEASLLAFAVEWAEGSEAGAGDALFAHRPAAWIVVRLGGADRLAEALPAATGCPGLVIDLDADAESGAAELERWACDDREQEAQAAATLAIEAIAAGRTPLALVALDREGVRRVRALLERRGVRVADETGWALSTTNAAARLMALLRAAAPAAGHDALLAWLKTGPWASIPAVAPALAALEAHWRSGRDGEPPAAAAELWRQAQSQLAPFAARREAPLVDWLGLLAERLAADGTADALAQDEAGAQLLRALHLAPGAADDAAWQAAAASVVFDLADFTAWVAATLEAASFEPAPPAAPEVVLTPLARAIGRPFAQIIVPGADQQHLGAIDPAPALMSEAWAQQLGLPSAAARRERQRLAFAQLLHAPRVALLRRRHEADEPLAPSPLVLGLALARARAGRPLAPEQAWQPLRQAVTARPVAPPQPAAGADLPVQLSASSIEALRACPYRFFARSVLGLAEAEELETALDKRDYGNWLHAVLNRFHARRADGAGDAAALALAADEVTALQGIAAADLLPFRAAFDAFVPAYLDWLAERDRAGWSWLGGELPREAEPAALAPQTLRGRLDRVDRTPDGSLQVIDYKTGSVGALKARVGEPLEDTQLAVYAALEPAAQRAIYLALDAPEAPLEVEHPRVRETAATLIEHLSAEFARLCAGAPMRALGEGAACEFCAARGLCRKDHWSAVEAPEEGGA